MTDEAHDAERRYTVKPVTTPLPSRDGAARFVKNPVDEPLVRDITEDDDGYHPYADAPDTRPLFEEDPWR